MKQTFILDENVLEDGLTIRAQDAAARLVQQILTNCHRIAFSFEIWDKYAPRLSRLQRVYPNLAKPFFQSLVNGDKGVVVLDVAPLEDGLERQVRDAPDLPFVRLAAVVNNGAILATSDEPLRESVVAARINNDHDFRILPPEDALRWAGDESA